MQHNLQISLPRPRWLILAAILLLLTSGFLIALRGGLSPLIRDRFVKVLKERFQSDVDLKNFQISLFPRVRATGEELVFRHRGRTDVPPLISVKRFWAETGLWGLFSVPKQVRMVRLEGLQIHVPPRKHKGDERRDKRRANAGPSFVIQEINADGTFLQILPKKEGKLPLDFDISKLTLHSAGKEVAMSFRATLTNPKPPGLIQSTGNFGPWQGDEPSLTPVSGSYTFQNADLSVFRGIAGVLSSEGKYQGVLERIQVEGQTDTPDFLVKTSGTPVHLKTNFKATVDGTNGDTLLEPVNAQIISSSLVANGGVTGTRGVKGKTVSLVVTVGEGKLEDLLRLAVKSAQPPMTGIVSFKTQFRLPPGDQDIVDKLYLDGVFGIQTARFTSFKVQEKVETLSRRGKGQIEDTGSSNVVSNLKGAFTLKEGVITFSKLSFGVPGALVQLNGTYGLRNEKFDFRGTLRLDAKVSETTSGIKAFLLKAIDPLFKKKNAGAVIPIKVAGTRREPSFGLDIAGTLAGKRKERAD
jgi:hypothetical protein